MAEETVKLTADTVWQDGTPFSGYLEVPLQKLGMVADVIVFALLWRRSHGRKNAPSSRLGAYYQVYV